MKTVIIKLGGAAITNKKGSCQLAEESALDALMLQIQHAYESLTASGYQVILIHGAGSFGHPQARQYNLKEGWNSGLSTPPLTAADAQVAVDGGDDDEKVPTSTRKHQKAGFAHTRKCLLQLHLQLLGRLQQRGLPVLSLSPFDHVETDNGDRSSTKCFESLAQRADQLLKLGFIPLLHGDAVLDRTLGCTILSGDVVMHKLVMLLPNVSRCVFVTDVEGIFDMDPKAALNQRDRRPKLFKHMLIDPIAMNHVTSAGGGAGEPLHKHGSTAKTLAARKQRRRQAHPTMVEGGNGVVDVTGGMGGKNKWARQIILDAATQLDRKDVEIVICKSGSPEATRAMALDPVLKDGAPLPEQRMTVFSLANA